VEPDVKPHFQTKNRIGKFRPERRFKSAALHLETGKQLGCEQISTFDEFSFETRNVKSASNGLRGQNARYKRQTKIVRHSKSNEPACPNSAARNFFHLLGTSACHFFATVRLQNFFWWVIFYIMLGRFRLNEPMILSLIKFWM
jgi:hypothetical protein